MFSALKENGIFLLNTSATTPEEVDALLPGKAKRILARKNARFYVIDATNLAVKYKLGKYVNTSMGIVYFKLTNCMDINEVMPIMKEMIKKTYIKKGEHIVKNNWDCLDNSIEAVHQIEYNKEAWMNATVEKPHEIEGAFGAGKVRLMPATEGTGVIAGGPVRLILEVAGIKDIRTKSIGSNNPINCVKATFDGLCRLRTIEEIAALRGKTVEEIKA